MKDAVLVLTNSGDSSVEPVLKRLRAAGQLFCRFDTETFPERSSLTFLLSRRGSLEGTLLTSNKHIPALYLRRIKSVWLRRPVGSIFERGIHEGYAKFAKEESGAALWSLYSVLGDVFWMNHPLSSCRLLEHNKLYQLQVASRLGLQVPQTLITNEPEKALSFAHEHGGAIAVKMLKGNFFTKEGSNVPHFVFTQLIGEEQIKQYWDDIRMAPLMVQEYVPKDVELRVTIVGRKVFACAIHSQNSELTKHDWRKYDFGNVRHELCTLPGEVEQNLIALLRYGQWGWIEELTGAPIAETIAETLANAPADLTTVPQYLRD